MRFDLSGEEWEIIEPLLSFAKYGPARVDNRRVLNSIFYILRTPLARFDGAIRAAHDCLQPR
jgi:transposase